MSSETANSPKIMIWLISVSLSGSRKKLAPSASQKPTSTARRRAGETTMALIRKPPCSALRCESPSERPSGVSCEPLARNDAVRPRQQHDDHDNVDEKCAGFRQVVLARDIDDADQQCGHERAG